MDTGSRKMIVAILTPTPSFAFPDWQPRREIVVADRVYADTGLDDDNGFYDFLRFEQGVVGIRYLVFPEAAPIVENLVSGPGLKIFASPPPVLEIYNGPIRPFWNTHSGDQFMGDNYILRSESGIYAVTFGLSHLPPHEVQAVESWCGDGNRDIHHR